MSDDIAVPVNGIIKAFTKGNERAQRICNNASRNEVAAQVLDTLEPAQALQKSLAESEAQVRYAYAESIRVLGHRYSGAVQSDPGTCSALQVITINLQEQLATLSDYLAEPETFDPGSFPMIQRESERFRDKAIAILGGLHQHMLSMQQYQLQTVPDDRRQLASQREPRPTSARPDSQISPTQPVSVQTFSERIATEERRTTTRISSPSHYEVNIPNDLNIPKGTPHGSYKGEVRPGLSTADSSNRPREDSAVQLIDSAEVVRQMTSNEDFLRKREKTRQSFRQGTDLFRHPSTSSTATTPPLPGFAQTSPSLAYTAEFSESPIATSRPNSYLMARTQSREGQASLSPSGSSPRNSGSVQGRQDSAMSEVLIFGNPESPPNSGRQSAAEDHGTLAQTLRLPGYGEGVPDGIQVVGQLVTDPGLMLVSELHDQPTPATSVTSADYPLRSDASYYKFGGFCSGAHMIRRGTKGAQEVRKKPGAHLDAHISVKCIKCKYEISWDVYDRDNFLDKSGIYTIGDIRFRQRFLSKCHMPAGHMDDSAYACIFCVDEGKTVDDHDATVFFTLKQFFRHLDRHPRPLKPVEGLIVLYNEPEIPDFDIDFKNMESKSSPFANIEGTFRGRPTAHAVIDHRERVKGFKAVDPEKRATLQFAVGARIVGIMFSQRTSGAWCSGFHDGEQGYFPTSTVAFDVPAKDEVPTNPSSKLWATAKWDHKPKEHDSRWLTFRRGDKITNIDFASTDAWCYSGHHKGRRGLFPACFVESVKEDATLGQVAPIPGRHSSGDASPRGHAGIGSFLTRRTTANSTTSTASG